VCFRNAPPMIYRTASGAEALIASGSKGTAGSRALSNPIVKHALVRGYAQASPLLS
jgi:hypothetical protein